MDLELFNPVRRVALFGALVFLFFRFGYGHELLHFLTGHNFYVLFITSTSVAIVAIFSGGLRRAFSTSPGQWWLAFTAWMGVAAVFSTWRGGSAVTVKDFLQISLVLLLIVAGLAVSLRDSFRMMYAMAVAGVLNLFTGRYFLARDGDRLSLEYGSIANPNDLAAHLLYILPFLLFFVMRTGSLLLKAVGVLLMTAGVFVHLSTGSRGGLVALGIALLYCFFAGPKIIRLASPVIVVALATIGVVNLPQYVRNRYATIVDGDSAAQVEEATSSLMARQYLLLTSLHYTLTNPITGVGPGEFSNVEGTTAQAQSRRGTWQVTHNSYTQVSSEMGIPGLVFFLGAMVSTARVLRSIRKKAAGRPELRDISAAAFCLLLSLVGYGAILMTLSQAYSYYLPTLTAFAIALNRGVERELAAVPAAR